MRQHQRSFKVVAASGTENTDFGRYIAANSRDAARKAVRQVMRSFPEDSTLDRVVVCLRETTRNKTNTLSPRVPTDVEESDDAVVAQHEDDEDDDEYDDEEEENEASDVHEKHNTDSQGVVASASAVGRRRGRRQKKAFYFLGLRTRLPEGDKKMGLYQAKFEYKVKSIREADFKYGMTFHRHGYVQRCTS